MQLRLLFLLGACLVGVGLLAISGGVLALAAPQPALTCSVPGDHASIQAAINDLSCASIDLGAGVHYETVVVSRSVSIGGAGASNTIVDGQGQGSVFTIQSDVIAIISKMTIRGGSADLGGGIFNEGTLTLIASTLSGNSGGSEGGGIYNDREGVFTLSNSSITGNDAYDGAGIVNEGRAHVISSTLTENHANQGGAVFNHNRMTVISSTLHNNRAENRGGAILSGGRLTVTNSIVSDNLVDTVEPLVHNGGGGVFLFGGSRFFLTNSTLSGNSAVAGGGILAFTFSPAITLTNSTLYGNVAATVGGGVRMVAITPTVSAVNTIVAGNTGGDCAGGLIVSRGHNLAGDASCAFGEAGDMNETDPLLSPLGAYGGPTASYLPLPGSPAINAGDDGLCPAVDQRGISRPQDGNGSGSAHCDIGAVEARRWFHVRAPVVIR